MRRTHNLVVLQMNMKLISGCVGLMILCGYCACVGEKQVTVGRRTEEPASAPKTNVVRVVDFEDSGHHLLIWNITFETVDGHRMKSQMPHGGDFVRFAGLESLSPNELDKKTDFSSLPWFKITIQDGRTFGLRSPRPQYRLIAWEKAESKKAEPPSAR